MKTGVDVGIGGSRSSGALVAVATRMFSHPMISVSTGLRTNLQVPSVSRQMQLKNT
jgi:hypothetical protein